MKRIKKKSWILFALMLIGYFSGVLTTGNAETIRFAPLPMENRETVIKQFRPFIFFIEQRLHQKVENKYSDCYFDILEKFRGSQIDLAFLGPLPYVELRDTFPNAEPLVHFKEKSGNACYTCSLVTFPDADFDIHKAIKRKIALTQPLSTCGYLSTGGLLRLSGSDLNQNYYRYVWKHDNVALSVIRGEFDAGGLKTAIANKYKHMGLKIIAETPPLPGFALVANTSTLSQELISRLREELIGIEPNGKDKDLLSSWGDNIRFGTVEANDADYQVIRELLDGNEIPTVGNY